VPFLTFLLAETIKRLLTVHVLELRAPHATFLEVGLLQSICAKKHVATFIIWTSSYPTRRCEPLFYAPPPLFLAASPGSY
jgi:hypothetical protein